MGHAPPGVRALAAFFIFGACMSLLACAGLLFPGGAIEPMWQINPKAHEGLLQIAPWGIVLMGAVSIACALSAAGLITGSLLGYWLAITVLTVNVIGDSANAILGGDPRTLIGLPIGAAFIAYLLRPRIRILFKRGPDA